MLDYSFIDRSDYSVIESFKQVGDDMVITANVDPGKSFILKVADEIGSNNPFQWYYGGGETVLKSQYGEIFFTVPRPRENQQRYFRLCPVENPDKTTFVQVDIISPENSAGPICPKPGKVELASEVKADPRVMMRPEYFHWLADTGETGQGPTFSPTFEAGVHWVKLTMSGAASEAAAFKWIIVR